MSKIPEGTQFIEAGCGEKGFRKFEKGCWWFFEGFWRHVDWSMGALTLVTEHPDYAAPATTWTGEGLPPIGTVCETNVEGEWETSTVLAHHRDMAIIHRYSNEHEGNMYDPVGESQIRPIRTPEQIAEQELREALEELAPHIAGYMGRDDPTGVDVGLAAYLLDHGYRKQSSP